MVSVEPEAGTQQEPAMTKNQTGVGDLVATSPALNVWYVAAHGPTALATSLLLCAMDISMADATWQYVHKCSTRTSYFAALAWISRSFAESWVTQSRVTPCKSPYLR